MIERLVSSFTSDYCQGCGQLGSSVCGDCIEALAPARASRCGLCNTLSLNWRLCSNCRRSTPLAALAVASNYEGQLKQILRRFKYNRQRHLAEPLSLLLEPLVKQVVDAVTWVPTTPQRRRQRGYDQAELLARSLATRLEVEARPTLIRVGSEHQVGLSRAERRAMAPRQFAARASGASDWGGQRVLLVDDVVTTGATMSAAANCIAELHPKSIAAVAVAKS